MAYEFKGPGVDRPHPKKNWVNPDARQVAFGSGRKPKRQRESGRDPGPSREPAPSREPEPRRARGRLSLVQVFAGLFGLVFLLVGVAGFIPGVTSGSDDLSTYGLDSKAELLDLFRVSILHNAVHVLFAVGLLAALKAGTAKLYLLVGGVVYLGVAAYGFVIDQSSDANFLPFNDNDNLLHVGLSVGMILLGLVGVAAARRAPAAA